MYITSEQLLIITCKEGNEMLREVVEICPHCDHENILQWDVEKDGYIIKCGECGREMFLCDECMHPDGEFCDRCNWQEFVDGDGNKISACFRGWCRERDGMIKRERLDEASSDKDIQNALYTQEIAAEICELFEDLLDKHGILIPDEDRPEGNDTSLYGMTYGCLLGDVEDIIIDVITTIQRNRRFSIIPGEFNGTGEWR